MKFMKKYGYFVGAFAIMGILFYSSAQPYGNQSLVPKIEQFLPNEPFKDFLSMIHFNYAGQEVSVAASGYAKFIEFFIRKGAHFGTYFLMASFWYLGFRGLKPSIKRKAAFIAWGLSAGYAMLDEFHQSFTADRTPLFQDVLLDSIGALTGILFVMLILSIKKRRSFK